MYINGREISPERRGVRLKAIDLKGSLNILEDHHGGDTELNSQIYQELCDIEKQAYSTDVEVLNLQAWIGKLETTINSQLQAI